MKTLQTTALELPAYWASALINGDLSGLSGDEQEALDGYLGDNPELGFCLACSDVPSFMWRHDASGYELAGDCLTYTFELLTS